jgi:prephenate dehydrogenase
MPIQRLSIIGTGLIGGSVALAAKKYINNCQITAYDPDTSAIEEAIRQKAIDRSVSLGQVGNDAQLVILCTPVGQFERVLREIAPNLSAGTILTDVGSTKRTITKLAAELLPKGVEFIGSHPMAGSEKRGMAAANADLFQRAVCMVMPNASTPEASYELVERFWTTLGMVVKRLSPDEHDRIVARISHLPQVLAMALTAIQSDKTLPYAGKGFKDTTRIAASDPKLWRDILLDNADEIRGGLSDLIKQLEQFQSVLDPSKQEQLVAWLEKASTLRRSVN